MLLSLLCSCGVVAVVALVEAAAVVALVAVVAPHSSSAGLELKQPPLTHSSFFLHRFSVLCPLTPGSKSMLSNLGFKFTRCKVRF